jgi:type II secretory pathway component GspD/PulD (secretin)
LDGGAASTAEALRDLLLKMRANPVKVVLPTGEPSVPARPQPPKKEQPGKKEVKPGAALPPITITALGNKLIVNTDDRQAMALVADLLELLKTARADGDFEVIRLRHARAAHVAQVLDEAFNGPAPARGGFGGPGKGGAGPGRLERIRVIAEPVTNSVLVKASVLDMLSIRRLLNRSLDSLEARDAGGPGAAGDGNFEVIRLKHAKAIALAAILEELFNDARPAKGFGAGLPRAERIRLVADPATNSLILRATPVDVMTIRQLLIRELDVPGAGESRRIGPPKEKS